VVQGGRNPTGLDAIDWIRRAVELGAGEVLLTSIDRDGTQGGFDLTLLRAAVAAVDVPVVASGGAGSPADKVAAIVEGHADAVLAASIFHRGIHSIGSVKEALADAGVPVRRTGLAA
jgi:cyclase